MSARSVLLAALLIGTTAAPSRAQSVGPIPPFVFDLRGFYPGLGQDPITAGDLKVRPEDLPSRGLGGALGAHVYPLRSSRVSLGIGGEAMLVRGKAQPEDTEGDPVGLPVKQELKGLSGQVSLNFGDRNGWSYLTGGMGPVTFKSYLGESSPGAAAPNKMTINMGGGARWFFAEHVALTFDVRFYLTRPEAVSGPFPGRQRARLVFLSGGVAFQ
jgi:hypothetical protein